MLYRKSGRQKAAEPYYLHALEIYEKQLGPEHADVASVLNNLAVFYTNERRYAEAEKTHLRALAIRRKNSSRPRTPTSRNRSATSPSSIIRNGDYARASELYRASLQIWEEATDKPPADYEIVASNYADLLRSLGKAKQAHQVEDRARKKRSAVERRRRERRDAAFTLARTAARNLAAVSRQAHVAEWQTRTAQDRMGKPVEVRLLS